LLVCHRGVPLFSLFSLAYRERVSNQPGFKRTRILDTQLLCQKEKCGVKFGAAFFPAIGCRVVLHCPACMHLSSFELTIEGLVASVSEQVLPVPPGRRPI
jgi:hypothetical protein